jgi:HEPN domain-containing protein
MARSLTSGAGRSNDGVCFHCQQAAEKYLKALMQELARAIPRTHALEDLLNLLLPHHPALNSFRRGLTFLTTFAVETRYPGKTAKKRQATAVLRRAEQVRAAARTILGLRQRPPRRKK